MSLSVWLGSLTLLLSPPPLRALQVEQCGQYTSLYTLVPRVGDYEGCRGCDERCWLTSSSSPLRPPPRPPRPLLPCVASSTFYSTTSYLDAHLALLALPHCDLDSSSSARLASPLSTCARTTSRSGRRLLPDHRLDLR